MAKQNSRHAELVQNNLPKGWVRTSIESISVNDKYSIRMGPFGSQLKKHELVDSGIRVLWIENIVNNKFENKKEKFITNEKYKILKGFSVKPNDVLITMMGTIGRTCVVPRDIGKAIISSHLLKITPHINLIDSTFLTYLVRGDPQILKQIESKSRGVVMKGLNTKTIKSLEFYLPPLNEQKRIVTKIESIFAQIDAAREQLERLVSQTKFGSGSLNALRSSALKQAFEGKLVPQDPNDEPAEVLLKRIHKDSKIEFEQTDLPKGWIKTSISPLSTKIHYGYTAKAAKEKIGPKYLRITDIQNHAVDWRSVPHCQISPEKIDNFLLHPNDLIFARTGATVGKSFLVRKSA